ncbi:flagellar type III secretion system protein FlhB [Chitinibacter bivalviorum]|uniref:Flagellar biosynthetic protein FlhB n=1 Tax=Chitinibacter bivalviorum TaxID=2739434 RepID=A0A7H9BF24_9NEIS|nr:flagellar biosynthesis protein FlhB [Chitinibacter bivalviorum]QLG86788.1 flagellar type III secretion system protein FlhB [Chitinibacter bivalviorum]
MAEDSDLERTEPASPKRLEEARKKGQVPRSHELTSFSTLMVGMVAVIVTGPELYAAMKQVMLTALSFNRAQLLQDNHISELLYDAFRIAVVAILPIFAACIISAILTPIMIGGWLMSFEALGPNFARMNPMSGIGRMFSARTIVETVKTILKSGLIGGVAAWVIWNEKEQFIQLLAMDPESSFAMLWQMTRHTLILVVGAMAVIVIIDVPYQLWDYYKGLRMTKEEVRQENKESEGDPHVKGRIRQLQREAARKRMMSEIPKANVVVTNPTHYAVAIRYDEQMRAPKVVAKGAFLLAERIISLAKDNKVTVVRTPPFARALYHHAELGEEIPTALYTATAEVLAYIYQLDMYRKEGGFEPTLNTDLPVPPELDPESGIS